MDLRQKIKRLAAAHYDDAVGIRRHIHRFPELSYEEYNTSAYLQEQLRSIGIPFKSGYLKNGIVATIEGKKATRKAYSQRVVALRAEMDALPIVEKNDIPFKSENHGKMHACGHDMHMAALLGAAMMLNELRASVKGTVMLIFQPGEEKLPGGADQMIREGIFADLKPSVVIGQHVLSGMYTGTVGYRPGVYMASSDEIYLNVKGKGGHGGVPHQMIDPVLITAHIIVALQQVVSRNANAATPTVLSFGKIHAPGTTNVVPDEVFVEGTFRTMNETWRHDAHEKIVKIAGSIASGMGGSCEVTITHGYPMLENNEAYTQRAMQYSRQLLGDDKVLDMDLRMTSDDFAYYSQQFPAIFYRFGTTDADNKYLSPVHTAHYMADEKSLETAMANLAWLTISFLADE